MIGNTHRDRQVSDFLAGSGRRRNTSLIAPLPWTTTTSSVNICARDSSSPAFTAASQASRTAVILELSESVAGEEESMLTSTVHKAIGVAGQPQSQLLGSRVTGKLDEALDSLFRRRNFQEGGYWTEWTEKDEKHQMFISLQLSDSRRSGAP